MPSPEAGLCGLPCASPPLPPRAVAPPHKGDEGSGMPRGGCGGTFFAQLGAVYHCQVRLCGGAEKLFWGSGNFGQKKKRVCRSSL